MREKATLILYPLITLVVVIFLWSLYLEIFEVPSYILPDPFSVFSTFIAAYSQGHIWPHLFFTFKSTVLGYFVGCGLGLILGSLLAESRTFEKFMYIYVVILQSMPKVALAPLIIVWFGFGIESKIVMVALICFFPVFINTFVGIRQAESRAPRCVPCFFRFEISYLFPCQTTGSFREHIRQFTDRCRAGTDWCRRGRIHSIPARGWAPSFNQLVSNSIPA